MSSSARKEPAVAGRQPRRRGPGRPPAASSEETRDQILRAARHQFAIAGYDGCSIKDIAAAAGVTTGAVYYYFDSKSSIYRAVGSTNIDHHLTRLREAVAAEPSMPPVKRLHALIDVLCDDALETIDSHRIGVAATIDGYRHEGVAQVRAFWADSIRSMICLTADIATPPNHRDVDDPVGVIVEMIIMGFSIFLARPGGPERIEVLRVSLHRLIDASLLTP